MISTAGHGWGPLAFFFRWGRGGLCRLCLGLRVLRHQQVARLVHEAASGLRFKVDRAGKDQGLGITKPRTHVGGSLHNCLGFRFFFGGMVAILW